MKKICIAALAATLALGTMITAQAADTTEPTYPKQYRSVNGGRLRGLKSPAGGAWEELADGTWKYHFAEGLEATDYWLEIDGTWYYFGHDNIMQTGFGIQQAINADTVANMQNTNALQAQLANCCCETREAIQGVNYNMAQNTCALQNTMNSNTRDIIDSQNAGTRAILDYLCNEKISSLQAENNDLRRAASQDRQSALLTTAMASQTQQLINAINPAPIPAYQVPNPNTYYGCGCGCNTGCNC